jgi:DNA-binding transcriptional MerR regulator
MALTTAETAAALGLRPTTIWRLTQRGLLKPNRSTRRPLYAVAEIERFLAEGKI